MSDYTKVPRYDREKVKPKCPRCGRDCVLMPGPVWVCPPCRDDAEMEADE